MGRRVRNEVLEVCGLIVQQPLLWRERAGRYRRVNCPVFPYYIAPNRRAGGDGRIGPLLHADGLWPAAPQHDRYAVRFIAIPT